MSGKIIPKRMEIYLADLPRIGGSIQHGSRPVLIVQNNTLNTSSTNVIVIPMTSKDKNGMATHVSIGRDCGIEQRSILLCEQIQTIQTVSLVRKMGEVTSPELQKKIHHAIRIAITLI